MTTRRPPDRAALQASARRVLKIRLALGFTQRDWAYYLRVAVPTVSNWETARALPSQLAQARIREVAAQHGLDTRTLEAFS